MSGKGSWKIKLRFEDESKNGRGICSSVRYMNTCTALQFKPAFIARGRVLDFCAEGRGFVSQPGQKMISIFSPVTYRIMSSSFSDDI